jgi:D-inositol-3-phosphate glycosyltransferase
MQDQNDHVANKVNRLVSTSVSLPRPTKRARVSVGLLTGCLDRPYAFGLAMALASTGVSVEVIGGDEVDSPDYHTTSNIKFLNFGGRNQPFATLSSKLKRLAKYYTRLLRYAAVTDAGVLHILWNNKFETFDRTLLMLYYKVLGKKVALTAHNVNQARRDSNDSLLNRLTLRMQYRLTDHIFVHTQKMKTELMEQFDIRDAAITVMRHPINNAFPDSDLTTSEAKARLGIRSTEKAVLYFGRIRPYKGIEYLLDGFGQLVGRDPSFRLIIAGEPKKGSEEYLAKIRHKILRDFEPGQIISRIEFIPDEEMEVYLKGADLLVLPYKDIFQSGVLFLAYSYGLPVVATDVGSFREEIVEGRTGFLCKPDDPIALANAIDTYFSSALYKTLDEGRIDIREYADANHSWSAVAQLTQTAYAGLVERRA